MTHCSNDAFLLQKFFGFLIKEVFVLVIFSLAGIFGKINLQPESSTANWLFYLGLYLCEIYKKSSKYSVYRLVHRHWYFPDFHTACPHNFCYIEKDEDAASEEAVFLLRRCSQN